MTERLKDKVVVVTGSSQGLGKAVAVGFAEEGAKIITNNRKPGAEGGDAESVAKEIKDKGGEAVSFYGDASQFDVAEKIVQAAVDNFGKIDILVNNAGADRPRMSWNMSEDEWDLVLDSFLKSSFNCSRFAGGLMRKQKSGRIINTTSVAWFGQPGHVNYCAAKAGIVGLTRALAQELGRSGVTCNAYAPTAGTRFTLSPETVAGFKKRYEAGLITKERFDILMNMPEPSTVVPLLVYLCTDKGADINGQVFDITGPEISWYPVPVKTNIINKGEGFWSFEELVDKVPNALLKGYKNPSPPESE